MDLCKGAAILTSIDKVQLSRIVAEACLGLLLGILAARAARSILTQTVVGPVVGLIVLSWAILALLLDGCGGQVATVHTKLSRFVLGHPWSFAGIAVGGTIGIVFNEKVLQQGVCYF